MRATRERLLLLALSLAVLGTLGLTRSLSRLPAAQVASGVPFSTRQVITNTLIGARAAYAADLDGDGDLDLLSASSGDDRIIWYENDGAALPAFAAHPIGTGDYARSVYAADLDGDGDLDVLAASQDDDTVAWYENDGASPPAFTRRIIASNALVAQAVRAIDLDRDGDVDVLSASNGDDRIAWYENDGASPPTFTARTITTNADGAYSVEAADVDGDGDIDVLSASRNDATIAWYESNGLTPPTFTENLLTTSASTAESVFPADVDGDADVDVVFAAMGDNRVAWYENRFGQGGGWVLHDVSTSFIGPHAVYAADMDHDGDTDILISFANADMVCWYENLDGSGTSWRAGSVAVLVDSPEVFAVADLDGDGDIDVAVPSFADNSLSWYSNWMIHRSAIFPAQGHAVISDSVAGARAVAAADLDGDGDIDVASASFDDNTIAWYESNGATPPTFASHVISDSANGAIAIVAADLGNNGSIDLLSANAVSNTIVWYHNNGVAAPTFTPQVISDTATGVRAIDVADVDGDGDPDVLSAITGAHTVAWHENSGLPPFTFTSHVISDTMRSPQSLHAADLDGDGDVDVLAGGVADTSYNKALLWFENSAGDGTAWNSHRVAPLTLLAVPSLDSADLDRDGDLDVIVALSPAHAVAWYENSGSASPTFTMHLVDWTVQGIQAVTAADADRDGDVDIFATARDDNAIVWLESDGGAPPTFSGHLLATGVDGAAGLAIVDVDGDGDADVLSAAANAATVAWHENRGGQVALLTDDTAPPLLAPAAEDDVLRIVAVHRGRPGDRDAQIHSLELLLEESAGDPLTSNEANALIAALRLYRDDGSGAFEPVLDTPIATVAPLSLLSGRQVITFAYQNPHTQLAFGTPMTYFVAVELTGNAAAQTPNRWQMAHITQDGSIVVDWGFRDPLQLEFAPTITADLRVITARLYLPLVQRNS